MVGVGQDLAYRVEAVDPDAKDAGKLVYSLSPGPRGMVLDRATNMLHFTATSDQVGVHRVDLRAADPLGLVGYQSFWLRVSLRRAVRGWAD
ncbi:MAG: hypothetical protein HYV07_10580 [Deltaproteobacteria bacterium]|nr:hypothetical protein [Deltaproteobacteria bacterium]